MTESGFEMPPDHMVSQIRSTLDFSSPVIMIPSRPSPIESSNRLDLGVKPLRGCAARWWSSGVTALLDSMVPA